MSEDINGMWEAEERPEDETTVLPQEAEAREAGESADKNDGAEPPQGDDGGRRRRRRVAGAAIAVVLVAGLGAGLALASRVPSQEEPPGATATTEAETVDAGLGLGDVAQLCTRLALDNADLSIDAARVRIEAQDGHVMVTQASEDDAATMVDATARRSAALARALNNQKVAGSDVVDVTWVTTDQAGNVKVAVANTPASAPAGGSTADVVNGSGGHVIADDVWNADGVHDQGFEQNGGETPKRPDGTEVKPGEVEPTPEQQPTTDAATGSAGGNTPSGPNGANTSNGSGNGADNGTNSGSGNGGSASPNGNGQGSGSQQKWVPEQGHWETTYEQVWVDEYKYVDHACYYVNHGGTKVGPFDSEEAAYDWIHEDMDNGGIGGSVINESYSTKEKSGGHYDSKPSGQRWVVDVPGYWE